MVTRTEYLQSMLEKIRGSYNVINGLSDKPGDIAIIRLELLRAKGIMQVIVNKINPRDYPNVDIPGLVSRLSIFLDDYYFERELDIMEPLYGDDPGRIRHLRLKILDSMRSKDLTVKIEEILSEL